MNFLYLIKKKEKEKQSTQKNRGNVDRGFWMRSIPNFLFHSFIVVLSLIFVLARLLGFFKLFKLFDVFLLLRSGNSFLIKPLEEKEGDQNKDGSANTRPL